METLLLVATTQGLVINARDGNEWEEVRRGLSGKHVTSVIARQGVILAGTTNGIHRSDDMGESWRQTSDGLTIRHVRWLAYHPDVSDFEFAGTEPASIYISRDGADTWRERPEVDQLRKTHGWFMPYSPAAGCVRGFAFDENRVYAAVEVGGVLRSDDNGETWKLAEGSSGDPREISGPNAGHVHPDVHSIAVHPVSSDLVLAPTGGGLYRSLDGGKQWECLYECYCRAVWLDPTDPDNLILGPASGVDRDGRIEATRDGGHTWLPASTNLDTPWRRNMVERFCQVGDDLLAVLSNGDLIAASLADLVWRQILPGIKDVKAVTTLKM